MTTALGLFLLATGVFYAVRLMLWRRGLHLEFERSDALPTPQNAALPTITVVIAARDEEATIGPCVDSVLATDYPREKLEVIVVDDDSSDQTAAIVRQRMLRAPALAAAGHELPEADWDESEGAGRLRLVQIPENRRRDRAHKKAAIEKAVRDQYEKQSDPYFATSRLWDDGLIEPAQTRDILGLCLSLLSTVPTVGPQTPVYRM